MVFTIESSDPNLDQLDMTIGDCTRTIPKVGGVFHLQREGACLAGGTNLKKEVIVTTYAESVALHTSCSVPLYVGYTFGSFTIVGYCIETVPMKCSGIVNIDTSNLYCAIPVPTNVRNDTSTPFPP